MLFHPCSKTSKSAFCTVINNCTLKSKLNSRICNNHYVSSRLYNIQSCQQSMFKVFNSRVQFITWIQKRKQDDKHDYPRLHGDIEQPNFDYYRKQQCKDIRSTKWGAGDAKPTSTYVIGFFGLMATSYALKSELTHFLSSMSAAADVLALATVEVDLGSVAAGTCSTFKWRGKPLFVKNRTSEEINAEANTPLESLRDPQTPEQRSQKPEWLIVIGICTHLGCVPIPNSGDYSGGFYCPCHGSHYDNIGRARKGPAPLNLEVPPYKFLSDTLVLVG